MILQGTKTSSGLLKPSKLMGFMQFFELDHTSVQNGLMGNYLGI